MSTVKARFQKEIKADGFIAGMCLRLATALQFTWVPSNDSTPTIDEITGLMARREFNMSTPLTAFATGLVVAHLNIADDVDYNKIHNFLTRHAKNNSNDRGIITAFLAALKECMSDDPPAFTCGQSPSLHCRMPELCPICAAVGKVATESCGVVTHTSISNINRIVRASLLHARGFGKDHPAAEAGKTSDHEEEKEVEQPVAGPSQPIVEFAPPANYQVVNRKFAKRKQKTEKTDSVTRAVGVVSEDLAILSTDATSYLTAMRQANEAFSKSLATVPKTKVAPKKHAVNFSLTAQVKRQREQPVFEPRSPAPQDEDDHPEDYTESDDSM